MPEYVAYYNHETTRDAKFFIADAKREENIDGVAERFSLDKIGSFESEEKIKVAYYTYEQAHQYPELLEKIREFWKQIEEKIDMNKRILNLSEIAVLKYQKT